MVAIRFEPYLLFAAALPGFAGPPPAVVTDAVVDRYRPASSIQQQKLTGVLGSRIRANNEGFLEHVNQEVLLTSFDHRDTKPQTAEFAGQQPGLFLTAIVNAFAYSQDPKLKQVMDTVAKKLIATQQPDGYLGAPAEHQHWDDSDVQFQRYGLLGLLAYYRASNNEQALAACKNAAELVLKVFDRHASVIAGNASGLAFVEPLLSLYRATPDPRYLDFCKSRATAWVQANHSDTSWNSDTITDLTGLLALYRVTGTPAYLKQTVTDWKRLNANQLSLPASFSSDSDEGRSPCTTANWMYFTLQLYRLTGDSIYGDALEEVIYNQLLSAQDPNTGLMYARTPVDGTTKPAPAYNACLPAESFGISLIPAGAWGRFGAGVALSLYSPGRGSFQLSRRVTVQIFSETTYPQTGEIVLHVEPTHPIRFPLRLRVPAWAKNFSIDIPDSHLKGKPGEFAIVNREWHRGDTVTIKMEMAVRSLQNGSAARIAVQRGPQLLALSRSLNPEVENPSSIQLDQTPPVSPETSDLPPAMSGGPVYSVAGEYNGSARRLLFVPVSDAEAPVVWFSPISRPLERPKD